MITRETPTLNSQSPLSDAPLVDHWSGGSAASHAANSISERILTLDAGSQRIKEIGGDMEGTLTPNPKSRKTWGAINGGTPKSSIFVDFSRINHPFWGTPIYGNPHILKLKKRSKNAQHDPL